VDGSRVGRHRVAFAARGRRLRVVGSSPVVLRPTRATGLDRDLEVARRGRGRAPPV